MELLKLILKVKEKKPVDIIKCLDVGLKITSILMNTLDIHHKVHENVEKYDKKKEKKEDGKSESKQ